jgi:hypothetical protein
MARSAQESVDQERLSRGEAVRTLLTIVLALHDKFIAVRGVA